MRSPPPAPLPPLPPRFSDPLLGQGACTVQPSLSTFYKSRAPPLLNHLPLQSFPNTPSLGPSISSCALGSYVHRPTPSHTVVGLPAAENDGTAGLKPESSISLPGFDAVECLRLQSFLSSQLDWLRYEHDHEHCLCSLSSLSHHYSPHDNASSVITTVMVCFGSAFLRCDLANRINASQRRGWPLPGWSAELRVGEGSR